MIRVLLTWTDSDGAPNAIRGYAPRPPIVGEKFRIHVNTGGKGMLTRTVTDVLPEGEFLVRGGRCYTVQILDAKDFAHLRRLASKRSRA